MTIEEKIRLIQEVAEEIVQKDELEHLLKTTSSPIAYDGFEPSGSLHIAQGLMRAININKMTMAGVRFKMLVADWHGMANQKLGGSLEKIQTTGQYFIEVWKACGMDMNQIEFVWASELVKNSEYWKLVIQIAKTNSIKRFIRTAEIMGRTESFDLSAAQIIYPCMQIADIFILGAHITQLGMDQRKVNMLAREIAPLLGFAKPIVVSHHMLAGLQKALPSSSDKISRTIALKMSKSKPDSAIFMTDTPDEISHKVGKAWCPEGVIEENPILEYCRYIIFEKFPSILIERQAKFGGNLMIASYDELEKLYSEKIIHPQDLKNTVIVLIDKLLQPVRQHFKENKHARLLLEKVKSFEITR